MSVTAQNNDYLVMAANCDDSTMTYSWPSPFTQRGILTLTHGDGGRIAWADGVAGGAEPGSYTLTLSSSASTRGCVLAWSGVHATSQDVGATSAQSGVSGASPWSVQATGVATGTAQRLLVWIGGLDNSAVSGSVVSAAPSASPSAWTEEIDGSTGDFANIAVYTAADAAGTFTTNVTAVQTLAGASGEWGCFLMALRPA